MKIKTILSAVGAAAAVAGLTPYKVSKDEETGEVKATALLWSGSYTPATEDAERSVNVNVGLNIPGKEGENDEAHLYTDDVTISYADTPAAEAAEAAASEAPVEEAAEAPAEEAPVEEAPAEEAPVEEAPAEEPAAEEPTEA